MTSGLGGLQYSEDAVAAKLSLDIPAGAEEKLKELSRYSGDLSANMQSIARFTGDYMNYLQSFPTIQRQVIDLQREQLQVLQQTATAMGAIQAAQGSAGFVAAGFGGGYGSGYGTGREVAGGYNAQRLPPGYERFNGSTQSHQIGNNGNGGNSNSNYQDELTRQSHVRDRVRERDQQDRQEEEHRRRNGHTNGGTGGRHRREGDEDEETPEVDDNGRRLARRIRDGGQGAAGGINDIGQLFTPGGSNGARMSSIARLLGSSADADGQGGAGLAGLLGKLPGSTPGAGLIGGLPMWAKGLGLAGAGVAAGTMAFNAVQNVGEGVQNLRNQDLKGHSLAGGLGVEKDVRLMAMNPLLTNDQSRDIIMGALKSGHSGDSYTSAVDFIKKNMIDMNMDVSKSVDLLKSNIDLGKQSIGSLTFDLLNTQALAGVGNKTTDQLSTEFKAVNDAMIAQGVDGDVASQTANGASAYMNGNYNGKVNPLGQADANGLSPISKMLAGIIGQGDSNPLKSVMRQRFAPNSDPSLTYMATGADTTKDLMTILKEKCREMTLQQWVTYAHTYGLSAALGDTGDGLALTKAFWEQMNDKKFDAVSQAASETADLNTIKVGGKDATSLPSFDAWKKQPGNENKTKSDYNSAVSGGAIEPLKVDSGMLQRLAMSHPKAVIVDPSGKKHLLDATNPDQATGIANGTWKIYDDVLDKDTKHNDDGSLSNGTTFRGEGTDSTNKNLDRGLDSLDLSGKDPLSADAGVNLPTGGNAGGAIPGDGVRSSGGGGSFGDSGSVDMGGNPTGAGGMQIGLTPEAKKLLTLSPFPGNVATDPNTLDSNAGANGATRNSPMLSGGGN